MGGGTLKQPASLTRRVWMVQAFLSLARGCTRRPPRSLPASSRWTRASSSHAIFLSPPQLQNTQAAHYLAAGWGLCS